MTLRKIACDGNPLQGDESTYLMELSTGVYTTLSEKLQGYTHAQVEEMTTLRYMTFIVFLSLWEHSSDLGDRPLFHRIANEWFRNQVVGEEEPKQIIFKMYEFTQLLRQVTPDEFVAIVDFWADTISRGEVERLYVVTDQNLQPTSKETKEALKNE